jgi:hypothetical protein
VIVSGLLPLTVIAIALMEQSLRKVVHIHVVTTETAVPAKINFEF